MTFVGRPNGLRLWPVPAQTARISVVALASVWFQVFVIETQIVESPWIASALPLALVVDIPIALTATMVVRRVAVAPWIGFVLGLAVDSYRPNQFGLHAGLFCLAAFGAPHLLGVTPGLRSLAAESGSVAASLLISRTAIDALFDRGFSQPLLAIVLSIAATTVSVVVLSYPIAGFLDRRSRAKQLASESAASGSRRWRQKFRVSQNRWP